MTANKQKAYALGHRAEAEAALFLKQKGYRILHLRKRTKGGELDLVAVCADTLVIVEVKARASERAGLESISQAKQARIARAAEALLAEDAEIAGLMATTTPNMRFDVVCVVPNAPPLHLEDAWRPES